MKLALIGFSGTGKSYWSSRLERERAYQRVCCDDLVEQKLAPELLIAGHRGIDRVASWLGQPFDEQFPENQGKYLDAEREVMREILRIRHEKSAAETENIVIDTTGSVIYTGEEMCSRLREFALVAFIKIPDSALDEMYQQFCSEPKPLIWGEQFAMRSGETEDESLSRCYRALLRFRRERYEQLADVVLDYNELREDGFSTDDFLKRLQNTHRG